MDTDVMVIGAGPVGMLAALLATRQGLRVLLLEQKERRHAQSRAVGIMPPTLEILRALDLDKTFIARGVPVRQVEAHGRRHRLGSLDFADLGHDYPFALSIPQDLTESLLESAVIASPSIAYLRGHRATACSQGSDRVRIVGEAPGGSFRFEAPYALACDGGGSRLREVLNIPFEGAPDRSTFIMGDFTDTSGWGPRARFFFTPRGSVESFPLPEGKRRYVLRTPVYMNENAIGYFRSELLWRAGVDIQGVHRFWTSSFQVERYLARSFCSGRIFLCGDAAHLMSPVGGQNMNTGFADAELAAWLTGLLMKGRVSLPRAADLYHRTRRRSARTAARRAHWMMRGGTAGGRLRSACRNGAAFALLHSPLRRLLVRPLSMGTIPFRNLAHCRSRFERELMPETFAEAS